MAAPQRLGLHSTAGIESVVGIGDRHRCEVTNFPEPRAPFRDLLREDGEGLCWPLRHVRGDTFAGR